MCYFTGVGWSKRTMTLLHIFSGGQDPNAPRICPCRITLTAVDDQGKRPREGVGENERSSLESKVTQGELTRINRLPMTSY